MGWTWPARHSHRWSLALLQGTFAFRTVPATLRVDDVATALNTAVEVGAIRVDTAAYRAAALEARNATGELLPGVVIGPEREHFGIHFGHAGMTGKDSADTGKED